MYILTNNYKCCLSYDPDDRKTTQELMEHPYFQADGWCDRFEIELKKLIESEREKEQYDKMRRRKSKKVCDCVIFQMYGLKRRLLSAS
jgi:serine/threonine protein kinase